MVTTAVSGAGCGSSILPAPVCVKPARSGVTCAWRAPSVIETGGAGAEAGTTLIVTGVPGGTVVVCPARTESDGMALSTNTKLIGKIHFMGRILLALRQNHVGSRSEHPVLPSTGARLQTVKTSRSRQTRQRIETCPFGHCKVGRPATSPSLLQVGFASSRSV